MRLPMPSRLIRPTETLPAFFALERLVARMRPRMLRQLLLSANAFHIPVSAYKRLTSRMRPLVNRQTSRNTERFSASRIVAYVGSFLRVRSHVLRQSICFRETLGAERALERSIPGVRLDVTQHFLFLREQGAGGMTRATEPTTFVGGFTRSDVLSFNVVGERRMRGEGGRAALPSTTELHVIGCTSATAADAAACGAVLALLAPGGRGVL